MNAMKKANKSGFNGEKRDKLKKQLIIQYFITIILFMLGILFTGITVFSYASSYVEKSEYNQIDRTSRVFIKNFDKYLGLSDNRQEALAELEQFFITYADTCNTNYYILDSRGNIILKAESVTGRYDQETISRIINAPEFSIADSKLIIYCKKFNCDISEGGVYVAALKSADEYYLSIVRIGEVLIVALTVVFIVFCVVLYLAKRRKFNLLAELNEYASDFVETGKSDRELPKTADVELAPIISTMKKMTEIITADNNQKLEFMSNISHELKTPITIIKGYVTGILDGTIEKDQYRKSLVRVSDQTNRMVRLINSMMKISGIESGDIQLNRQRVNMTELFVETLFMFEKQIDDKHVTVEGVDSEKAVLYGDRDILYQVVYNLVDNAAKFVNEGGKIKLKTLEDEHNIYLWFGNTGKGISGREMPRIFDRFYKTDFSRSHDTSGVGLGLSIVKKFVDFHHGSIILNSSPDEYTEFILTFPVDKYNVNPDAENDNNADNKNKEESQQRSEENE